ncbi:hypothetical protein [Ensifer sp. SL37]|uniref:hypothetical protein n=1 Tax=Ensifer sp. SL37 TaxID=2995137 RepID=UPI0022750A61|nr:hypothetical protein [Ensifer sp. SL37]MCY1741445.1 hypothetical protein [Ensifer sp. SL37]
MRTLPSVALLIGASSAVAGDTLPPDLSGSYLCKATASAGIRFDQTTNQWKSVSFNTENDAVLLKVKFTGKTGKYELLDSMYRLYDVRVKKFGEAGDGEICSDWGSSKDIVMATGRAIRCTQVAYNYWFNLGTRKFQIAYDGGYMDPDHNTNTPAITVGICDKID